MTDAFKGWNSLATRSWKRSAEQRWFHDYVLYPAICDCLAPRSRVLDYGCGSGELLGMLRNHGHGGVGFEPSVEMARLAQSQNPGVQIVTHCSSLGKEWFDTVVMNLVLQCVEDPTGLASAAAAYAPRLIVTVPHPCFSLFDDLHTTTRRVWTCSLETSDERELYFCQSRQAVVWDDEGTTTILYHRSITAWVRTFRECGLSVSDLTEPVPTPHGACIPRLYDRFARIPLFMLFDLRKEGGPSGRHT